MCKHIRFVILFFGLISKAVFESIDETKSVNHSISPIISEPLVMSWYENSHTKRWFDLAMSWVGPRPEQLDFVAQCIEKYPAYDARHAVKPGITGLAQIHNPNATIDDHQEKLVHDLAYMRTTTFWGDIQVLWRSLGVILKK